MRFFLVDRVDEIKPGELIRGVKNITLSEDFLQDHFPDYPVFPGTLTVEALAQLGGFLVEATFNTDDSHLRRAMLAQIEKAKFYEGVTPGDQLVLTCRLISSLHNAAQVQGEAFVNDQITARATLIYTLREVDSEKVHEHRRSVYQIWTRRLKLDFPLR